MQIIPTAPNLGMKMRKFRFVVLNSGQDGGMNMNEQPQIAMSPSPEYLINLYAQSGDRIRILEELPQDEETRNYGKMDVKKLMNDSTITNWAAGGSLGAGKMMTNVGSDEQIRALQAMQGNKVSIPSSPNNGNVQQTETVSTPQQTTQPANNGQISYFKVGSTECKIENGQVFRKQWVTVTEDEMQNYRLISDKTNRILPLNGKHLETLKWVMAQE